MYAFLPSRFEPGSGYIALFGPELGPAPTWSLPRLFPPDLAVSQVSTVAWHVPLGRAPVRLLLVLLRQGFRACRPYFVSYGGRGLWGRPSRVENLFQEDLYPTRTPL